MAETETDGWLIIVFDTSTTGYRKPNGRLPVRMDPSSTVAYSRLPVFVGPTTLG
jgi:hypothetical protein